MGCKRDFYINETGKYCLDIVTVVNTMIKNRSVKTSIKTSWISSGDYDKTRLYAIVMQRVQLSLNL
jgi:Cdc6-like AAA superfamily ATPase